jgi:acetolactate synthase-1/2/3 large subunit
MVDVDAAELQKQTIHVDLPIQSDAKFFLERLIDTLAESKLPTWSEWLSKCKQWQSKYPVVTKAFREESECVNIYVFMDELSKHLPDGMVTVTGNGSACVASSQAYIIKPKQRYISNSALASMGYDLPAAIGACIAAGKNETICLTGEGSLQMNIQELQTIAFHRLPIKIFVINNQGYHSLRQTEDNLFPKSKHVGIGPETDDLSFPELIKIAAAYELPYFRIDSNRELAEMIPCVLANNGPAICEIIASPKQRFEPKSATKILKDGSFFSPPLEDLAPFLPREELENIMIIPLMKE